MLKIYGSADPEYIPIAFGDVGVLAALGNCSCVALPPASMPSSLTPIIYYL